MIIHAFVYAFSAVHTGAQAFDASNRRHIRDNIDNCGHNRILMLCNNRRVNKTAWRCRQLRDYSWSIPHLIGPCGYQNIIMGSTFILRREAYLLHSLLDQAEKKLFLFLFNIGEVSFYLQMVK